MHIRLTNKLNEVTQEYSNKSAGVYKIYVRGVSEN